MPGPWVAGGEPVAHGELRVGDAGALVARDDGDASAARVIDPAQHHLASLCILDDVARHLGDGRGDQRAVGHRETELGAQLAAFLAGRDDVGLALDAEVNFRAQASSLH
jgi:hypothetical protein